MASTVGPTLHALPTPDRLEWLYPRLTGIGAMCGMVLDRMEQVLQVLGSACRGLILAQHREPDDEAPQVRSGLWTTFLTPLKVLQQLIRC